jgi:UDP-3-O-[3-hydroxymyristoyl] glucosamine N-acyltransferase
LVTITLGTLVDALGGRLIGDAGTVIRRLAPLATAGEGELAFVAHVRYRAQVATTRASALIVGPSLAEAAAARGPCIVVDDPYLYFARLTQWWRAAHAPRRPAAVHPSACIDPSARIGRDVDIGPFAVLGPHVVVGDGARIGAHVVLEEGATVGAGTVLHAHVTIGRDCQIGARCILHPGVVIGADGFGFAPHEGRWVKIEQLGAVRIGDDVEIGANTCVDRGALDDTVIGNGVKLDNLVQIGHNVRVGDHAAMAGCAGVAGSAEIGAGCTIGGGAVVLGHLSLAEGVHVSAASVVTRSIREPGLYTGVFPIDANVSWEKNAATLRQLHRLRDRLKAVERAIAHVLENPNDAP